jgi:hypothetical protein
MQFIVNNTTITFLSASSPITNSAYIAVNIPNPVKKPTTFRVIGLYFWPRNVKEKPTTRKIIIKI